MKKMISLLATLSVLYAYPAFAKLKVVTTLPSLADIAKNVGGDDVDVVSLTRGNQDPHFVDAKPSLVLALNKADLLIRIGLGLEDGWLPPLLVGSHNEKIRLGGEGYLEASSVIELKEVPKGPLDRAQGDVHPGGNPHFMLDPNNGVKVAQAIADRLGALDHSKDAEFHKRADAYVKELQGKIKSWETALKDWKGRPVVTYHKSWIYFFDWLGIKEAGTVEPKPGIPPSPEHVVALIRAMKAGNVKEIFIESYYPKGTAREVAQETGARLLVLPTEPYGVDEAKTYEGVFDYIVQKLH